VIRRILENINLLFFDEYAKYEKAITQISCLIANEGGKLVGKINKFPRKYRKYAMWKVYRLAFWGYSLDIILNELEFLKVTKSGGTK